MRYEIRKLEKEDILETSKIAIDSWKLEYSGFIPCEYLDKLNYEDKEKGHNEWIFRDGNVSFVAVEGSKVIGFCYGGLNDDEDLKYDSEVHELFVRREYQGEGIGIRLLYETIKALKEAGYKSVVIWNFKDSKSNSFYKHIGGRSISTVIQRPAGKEVKVEIFGWDMCELMDTLENKTDRNK